MSSFGSFDTFCQQVSLTVCPLVGNAVQPSCYSRNVELVRGSLLFSPATIVIHFIALVMTGIMIYHVKSKYTAVGRKEITMFFYMYIVVTILEMLLVSGWVPVSSSVYPWFTAAHVGMITTTCWCLLLNGFVGFQWAEDGTAMSLWFFRISSLVVFAIVFAVAISTFENALGMSSASPIGLFVIYFILNGIMLLVYVVLQIVLVINTLDDRWPLGDILFGFTFFVLGQIFMLALSVDVCEAAKHYIDGLFFGTICSLLGVMMVYKYWDSITKEDLEFSVGGKANVWEVRDDTDEASGSLLSSDKQ